jgi:glycosyltransferase involved in cell wall biosynthesis
VTTGLGYVFTQKSILTVFVSFLYKLAFFRSEQVWFLNQDDRHEFIKRRIIPASKSQVLPGEGIDLNEFTYDTNFPIQPTFLFIGRMLWHKGVGEFVEAAKIIKRKNTSAIFQLLGPIDHGNPAAISISQIESWSSQGIIEYLGESNDVRPFIRNATCIVLPSYREGIPRVLLEGSAIGRPIITSNSSGCRETVVDGETGFIVPIKDVEALSQAIKATCVMNTESLRKIGKSGRAFIQSRFSIDRVLEFYRKWP